MTATMDQRIKKKNLFKRERKKDREILGERDQK